MTSTTDVTNVLAERIRSEVLDLLRRQADRDRLDPADQRQLVRGWIEDQLGLEARRRMHSGEPALPRSDEARVVHIVESLIWGLGRLQALLDVPDVEDIHIVGSGRPTLRRSDGSLDRTCDPVADSDEDLIRQLQHIAAHHGSSERAFSPSQPFLNMQLPDGSRLAAIRDIVPHPTVTIRRHRLVDITLEELARMGTLSAGMLGFLHGVVGSKRSAVVTGVPASGKTTLLRAMARAVPPEDRVATLETEFELDLHRLPHASPLLVALECRAGSTEVDPATGRHAGEITLSDLLHQALRMSVTRVIVGEVRGAEALPMLEAMNAGMPGSLCTLHAGSASDAFERLVTAAMKGASAGWNTAFVTRLAAQGIDYVVHLRHLPHARMAQTRFVSEIAEVTDVNEAGVVAMNRIFGPGAGDPRGRFLMAPQRRWPFEEAGISLDFLRSVDVDRWYGVRRAS